MIQRFKHPGLILFGLSFFASTPVLISAETDRYKLSIGDRIVVEVHDHADLTSTQEIDPEGNIRLKYIGIVSVEGLSPREAESVIEREYMGQSYLRAPDASVRIEFYSSKPVIVRGAVNNPGLVELDRYPNGLDIFRIIAMAGGLKDVAKESDVRVIRLDENGNPTVFSVNMSAKELKRGTASEVRFIVRPHDIVEVGETTF